MYYRKDGDQETDDPLLAGLSDEEQQQVRQMRMMIAQMDVDALNQFLARAEQLITQSPPEARDAAEAMVAVIRQRLDEIEGGQ